MSTRRRPSARLAALATAVVVAACSSGTEPPTPTTIQISHAQGSGAVSLVSLGQTIQLAAKVLDQNGDSMPGQTISWSTSNAVVANVSAGGLVTAVTNGSAQVTASAGASPTGSVTITVAQAVTSLQKTSGDAQIGAVAAALANPIRVRALDALGHGVVSATVGWSVTTGGGSIAGTNTDTAGYAQATWTPGNIVGAATATASVGGSNAVFSASLVAGPAAQITIVAGNSQTAAVGTQVGIKPKARVADQFGNIRVGHTVTWTVIAGGGSVAPGTSTTDANGDATVTSWTMGASAGANSLQASAAAGVTVSFSATSATAGAAAAMAVFVGDNQTALASYATNIRPAVRVTDANSLPVSGQQVVFAPSAGGSVTGGTVTTNVNGIAQVGSWTPGTTAGAATLAATATGTAFSTTFNGTAANAAYNIDVRNIGPAFSPAVATAFANAEALWEQIIYGDQSDVGITTTNACGLGATIQETVDDVIILARFDSIDGPGQILGQAGACSIRGSNGLSIYGQMRFDTADVAGLVTNGTINAVILHEMGHVLGFSSSVFTTSIPQVANQIVCAQLVSAPGLDSHFNCTHAGATNFTRAMFDSIGGTTYTGGNKVPLENCVAGVPASCGAGTLYSHWRENTFFNELMTGYLNSGAPSNPLSVLTITAFQDIGYQVNYGAAQPYTRTFTAPAAMRGAVVDLGNDEYRGEITVVDDRTGRVVRVIRR